MTEIVAEAKYPKPKILLVDLPEGATAKLASAGFNVNAGTFGRPYRVPASDDFLPVIAQANLPNYTEQEVIILDLTPPEMADQPEGRKHTSEGAPDWYATASRGFIDPRPRVMAEVSEDWGRILEAGGAFVIFAQPRLRQELVLATARFRRFDQARELPFDNWSFLPLLSRDNLKITSDHGTETQVGQSVDFIDNFLRSHQPGVEFEAVLTPTFNMTYEGNQVEYFSLIQNKFDDGIGGIIFAKRPKKGRILILPQFKDKVRAVYELVTVVLPEMSRHLFPYFEGDRWVHADEYEHPSVLERKQRQRQIREEAEARVAALDKEIESEQDQLGILHGLLTRTGGELVADVQKTLEIIGFKKVTPPKEETEGTNKQEDLQVHDRSPCLLLEVKGIAGLPTEGDTLQGTKYVMRRMKQWERTDVSGVFLVNHQRNIPALERDHDNVFTEQQLSDAKENGLGLFTTWDLFRLVRGMMRWKWSEKVVQDVFYGKGRLSSVPSHYVAAGTVAHFYSDISVLSIEVGASGLRVGDTVGFLFPVGFFEEQITSLQVEKKAVKEAQPGQRAGYKTTLKRKDVPVGTPIYLVTTPK